MKHRYFTVLTRMPTCPRIWQVGPDTLQYVRGENTPEHYVSRLVAVKEYFRYSCDSK